MDEFLFDVGQPSPNDVAEKAKAKLPPGRPRLRVPERDQVEMHWASLNEMLEPDHPVRGIWIVVCSLDISPWLADIKAIEGQGGRDATDPRLLLALWIFATLEGVGSARFLAKLCRDRLPFKWLCGGVSVNHHMLSDFRSERAEHWDKLMTNVVAPMMAEGLVTMKRVAQDGMRVRANAGKASFRRRSRLEEMQEIARQQLAALKDAENAELSAAQVAAQERAAKERLERIGAAVRQCDKLQQQRKETEQKSGRESKEARASTTDATATNMKFPNGGYNPGYNVQFGTDTETGIIGGVDVTTEGTDMAEHPPMLNQFKERYGAVPEESLVDGGFASLDAIEKAAALGTTVFAPLKDEQKQLKAGKNPYERKKGDSPAVAAWRERMGTVEAKAVYRYRCQTAEWVNAICRNRGFWQMPVRGVAKCRIVATLFAITHNIVYGMRLRLMAQAAS